MFVTHADNIHENKKKGYPIFPDSLSLLSLRAEGEAIYLMDCFVVTLLAMTSNYFLAAGFFAGAFFAAGFLAAAFLAAGFFAAGLALALITA